jgi:hypothetical protein
MKKIFITLTLSIITIITCHAQLIHSSDFVKIPLPNGAYKISKQQVDALPGRIKIQTKVKMDYSPPYNYKVNNIVLRLFNVNNDSINNDLPRKKIFIDELSSFLKKHGNYSYKSAIEKRGSLYLLITSSIIDGNGQFRFFIQNAEKTLTQGGYIDYSESDAAKAEALLNDILNSIQFTK